MPLKVTHLKTIQIFYFFFSPLQGFQKLFFPWSHTHTSAQGCHQFSVIHGGILDVTSRLSHRDLFTLMSCHVSDPEPVSKIEADQQRWSCPVEIIPPPSERKLVISWWLQKGGGGGGLRRCSSETTTPSPPPPTTTSSPQPNLAVTSKVKVSPPWDLFIPFQEV